jgi:hypothetical protein
MKTVGVQKKKKKQTMAQGMPRRNSVQALPMAVQHAELFEPADTDRVVCPAVAMASKARAPACLTDPRR